MKIYIFKSYNDGNYYGEEVIEAFGKKEDALKHLKEAVESSYDLSWDEIPQKLELDGEDIFDTDYVAINHEDGSTSFWIVEGLDVE